MATRAFSIHLPMRTSREARTRVGRVRESNPPKNGELPEPQSGAGNLDWAQRSRGLVDESARQEEMTMKPRDVTRPFRKRTLRSRQRQPRSDRARGETKFVDDHSSVRVRPNRT
jgi:hypothetical protein